MKTIRFIATIVASLCLGLPSQARAKKVLLVVAPKEYLESEYENTRMALEAAGLAIEVASETTETATGYGTGTIKPDLAIRQASARRYAAIAVIGGRGAQHYLWNNKALHALLRSAHAKRKYVAAICAAPPVLANAGLLKGLKATMWPDDQWISVLEAGGAHYVEEPVVVAGRIVTGRNPSAATAFGKKLAELVVQDPE